MSRFIIAGEPENHNYIHAKLVATHLQNKLPDFHFISIEKSGDNWIDFLKELNKENKWYFSVGPVIWKEIYTRGGKKFKIGGLSEFWEYCFDYYGLESFVGSEKLAELGADIISARKTRQTLEEEASSKRKIIALVGAYNKSTKYLINDLLEIKNLVEDGIEIRIQHYDSMENKPMELYFKDIATYYNNLGIFGERQFVFMVDTLTEAIENADLLILLRDYTISKRTLSKEEWLDENISEMEMISSAVDNSGKVSMRIILCMNNAPGCFNATYLSENLFNIRAGNIVVVTADEGLEMLDVVTKSTNYPVSQLGAPPVWGFTGVNSFIDERSIICLAKKVQFFNRSYTLKQTSGLPKGTETTELRYLSYLVQSHTKNMKKIEENREKTFKALKQNQPNNLYKIKALCSLIKLWYARIPSDEIISLGIFSNGTFGIPNGIFFSQPVYLNSSFIWTPCEELPVEGDSKGKIDDLIPETLEVLGKYELNRINTEQNWWED